MVFRPPRAVPSISSSFPVNEDIPGAFSRRVPEARAASASSNVAPEFSARNIIWPMVMGFCDRRRRTAVESSELLLSGDASTSGYRIGTRLARLSLLDFCSAAMAS